LRSREVHDLFRQLNLEIVGLSAGDAHYALVCECKELECFLVVYVSREEWEAVSSAEGKYLVTRDHADIYAPHHVDSRGAHAIVQLAD
jgi:hypothetical protein